MASSKSFQSAFQLMALSLMLIGLYGWGGRSLACTEEERVGLMNLKTAFNLTDWFTWQGNRTSDCCRWFGVTCSNTSMRVTKLQLDIERPFDLAPWSPNASLFLPFQQLESLDLSSNGISAFTGTLKLKNLQVLRLDFNKLTQVPSLDKLPSLKEAYLAWNSLKNISHLEGSKLEVLDISGTNLDAESLSIIWNITSLEYLDLTDSGITAFTGTLKLKNLQVLRLNINELTQVPSLDKLPSLKEAYLAGNSLKNLSHLEGSQLEVLDLSLNHLGSESLSTIWNITSLEALSISINHLNISIFPGLCQLLRLEVFSAADNDLVGSIPPCLQNLTSLYAVNLQNNHFGGNIPSSVFHSLKSPQYISLSGNAFDGSFSLATLNNNSRLIGFELIDNYYPLSITTENPLHSPSSQLKIFRLSHYTIDEPHGVIPTFLKRQRDLRFLELSHGNMGGDFPSWLLENNTKLGDLILTNNNLSGSFALNSSLSTNFDMEWIDISSNYIDGELPVSIGTFFSNLHFINMSNNHMQGGIPSSLGNMKSLYFLDLSSNNFTGEIPQLLLNGCENLDILKLSDNYLRGSVLPRIANLTRLSTLYLDNNQFTGEICPGLLKSSRLQILDASNNLLSGAIPSWIGDFARLAYLSLSDNSLEGPLPLSLCKLNLKLLDLSSNDFGLVIPSCLNVSVIRYLSLENNHLTGPFPSFLNGASSMVMLDLGNNGLSGILPQWISSLSSLRTLLLKGNNFNGTVTHHLCRLKNISIMDLSYNKLSGTIPSCLSDMSFGNPMELEIFHTQEFSGAVSVGGIDMPNYKVYFDFGFVIWDAYMKNQMVEVKFISKSRYESYWGNILELMSGLDLSCNNLSGSIPPEIGSLLNLHVLNLSHNYLTGHIPITFSELKETESLDLSYNRLSGEIPQQLLKLYRLSVFSVAHNNLSGRTPEMKGQFATFGKKSYEGNPFLCGPPLESCSGQSPPTPSYPNEEEEDHSLRDAFRWSFTGSYVVTFLGTVAFFFLNSYYSTLIFNFVVNIFCRCTIG